MEDIKIKQLISRYRGISDAEKYFQFHLDTLEVLAESAKTVLQKSPPGFGECALLSASWAVYLQDAFSIPAIVVAGDLKVNGSRVFKTKKNIPTPGSSRSIINQVWDGHCWLEIDGYIGDLSLFRTAYSIQGPSLLKDYIVSTYGLGRGAMLCPKKELPTGLKYIPKYVLTDKQINSLLAGMVYKNENIV